MAAAAHWTEAEVARLRQLVDQKMTGHEIAAQMGRSRNAVAGKCSGLGLRLVGASAVSANASLRARIKAQARVQKLARVDPVDADPVAAKPDAELLEWPHAIRFDRTSDSQCRFSIDLAAAPTADMLVCGARVIPGLSWCQDCAVRVFNRPQQAFATLRSYPR